MCDRRVPPGTGSEERALRFRRTGDSGKSAALTRVPLRPPGPCAQRAGHGVYVGKVAAVSRLKCTATNRHPGPGAFLYSLVRSGSPEVHGALAVGPALAAVAREVSPRVFRGGLFCVFFVSLLAD